MNYQNALLQKNKPQGWAIVNVFKKFIGIIIMCSILKMVVFPSASSLSEAELLKTAQRDFRLTEEEVTHIKSFDSLEEQKDAYKKIFLHKVKEQQKELKI
jgi:hypothetical protein